MGRTIRVSVNSLYPARECDRQTGKKSVLIGFLLVKTACLGKENFFMLTGRERLATIRYKRIWPVSISSKAMG